MQYAGRLHRQHRDKVDVRIFDYVDSRVPMLARMFDKRLAGYRAMGYELAESVEASESSVKDNYVIEYDSDALAAADSDAF